MKPQQLRHLNHQLLKAANKLKEHAKTDPEFEAMAKQLSDLWHGAYTLLEARDLKLAEKQDKGVVLWEVFVPEPKLGRRSVVTRTPNRLLRWCKWDYLDPKTTIQRMTAFDFFHGFRRAMDGQAY